MSVMEKIEVDQSNEVGLGELNERERTVIQFFRLLDEVAQQDIIRFIYILLQSEFD
ncbi:hypothetical protein BSG18_32400 [Pseudomonas ogarae]|uniref:hypothetical protein n=1 Tax=Pseudomonas ogarae (strain DSM 112162 / CECT 30235 / F113) TaxID=1114970 RepID=UPI001554ED7E|nr:hypothetical protein [Pseudomonas ogarae]PBJ21176.1 hypothetical protein BSG18_32400 [Pseudomonas ogarae]